ncbi:MAG TPA: DNA repair protein RadC [Smithella sp.]|jgi:DNA repair protein RadC|nr:DNA repair protein RadC [Smithella sp.]
MSEPNKKTGINSWPQDDRPREKLLKKGAGILSNSELLAILLRTGIKGESAIDLARRIIDKFGTFRNMSHTDMRQWKEFKGLGPAKIAQIQAALEIGRRFREVEVNGSKQKISSARDIVDIIMPQMRDLKTELFKVFYLNNNNRIIEISDTAVGTVNHAMPIVREIIHAALQKFAAAIICVHNHPSANIAPSPEDKKFTQELIAAGKLMDIKVLDHIIIGDNTFFSFAEEGLTGR